MKEIDSTNTLLLGALARIDKKLDVLIELNMTEKFPTEFEEEFDI